MSKYLFFDTETTGLPRNWKAPASDTANWPRMVQLAWILCDENGEDLATSCLTVKPVGFEIPEKSTAVHGITTEQARLFGEHLETAVEFLAAAIQDADTLVGHNVTFDEKIVGAEFYRLGLPDPFAGKKMLCTMMGSVKFCGLQGKFGLKWPRLIELHEKLFGKGFDGAHDAKADVRACKDCFFELRKRGVMK